MYSNDAGQRVGTYTEQAIIPALAGAEGRYEDWVYLVMIEREWKRSLSDEDDFLDIAPSSRPAPRAVIILIFWSYFETRVDRFLRHATRHLPTPIAEDLLTRYSSISSRLDRLYRILFSTTYWDDLKHLGFDDVSALLRRVHERRNQFAHGHPEAIDVALITELVAGLKREHEAWVAVFNKRAVEVHRSTR